MKGWPGMKLKMLVLFTTVDGKNPATRVSMEVSHWLVSWFITYLQDLQPTYIGVIIHLLSTMDIPVTS